MVRGKNSESKDSKNDIKSINDQYSIIKGSNIKHK